jgi:Spy/CpxP family protein refolding chaperone
MIQSNGETFIWNSRMADILDFTPEQREQMRNILQDFRTQRPQGIVEMQAMAERIKETRERVNESLRPEQRKRFGELGFQLAGGLNSRFLNDRMLEIVALTPAQREQIRQLATSRDAEASSERQRFTRIPTREDIEALSAVDRERNERYAEQIKAVLTPEQRARAERLTAEIPELHEKFGMTHERFGDTYLRERMEALRDDPWQERIPDFPRFDSWQPGQPLPSALPTDPRGNFPRF